MGKQGRKLMLISLVLLLVMLVGCTSSKSSQAEKREETKTAAPATTSQPSADNKQAKVEAPAKVEPKELQKFTIGVPRKSFSFLNVYFAVAKGFFKEEGMDMTAMEVTTPALIPALVNQELQFGGSGSSVMAAAAKGMPVKAIYYGTERMTFYLMVQPEIKTIQDLKGKIIGVTSLGSTTDIAARMALRDAGMSEKDATMVTVGTGAQANAALASKAVQGAMLNVDAALIMQQKGMKNIVSMAEGGNYPFSGLTTSDQMLEQRQEDVKRFLRAIVKATSYMAEHQPEVAEFAVKEFNLSVAIAPEAVAATMKATNLKAPGMVQEKDLINLLEAEIRPNLPDPKVDLPLAKMVNLQVLKEVLQELGYKLN